MKCLNCPIRLKAPKGKTRETQICAKCRGIKSGYANQVSRKNKLILVALP